MKTYGIILAAGKGTRMKTELPKCAFPLLKKPMVTYIIESLKKAAIDEVIAVVGHKKEVLEGLLGDSVSYAYQLEQIGTANAVLMAKDIVVEDGVSIILPGDTPLIDETIIADLLKCHKNNKNDFTIGTIKLNNPFGFGRIIRNEKNQIVKIVEEKDATEEQRNIEEINTGVFCIDNKLLFETLPKVNNNNAKGEYYLTDIVEILAPKAKIGSFTIEDKFKLTGINDLYQLSLVEEELRKSILKKHMLNGVSIMNPNTVTISPDSIIESGTIIYQGSMIMGKTIIGHDCIIGPNTETFNAVIEDNVRCNESVIYDSKICHGATVGPFAHLRMNAVVGINDRIGNFVEIKKSTLGEKTNVAHLTYIGDTTCGSHVNWGCGCVTVNYDGKSKFPTKVGDNVFIGCNTNLIAPVTVNSDSYIAAGSTITKDIESGDMVIARAREIVKKGYSEKYKK